MGLAFALHLLGTPFALPLLAPFRAQPRELHLVDRVHAFRAAFGKAPGRAVPEHEHQQAVVMHYARADELAVGIDRHLDPVERAVHRGVLDPLDAEVERGLPGPAEAFGARLPAQVIGALGAHIDRARRRADAAAIGERLDEAPLALLGPAIVALALARHGGEARQLARGDGQAGFARVGLAGHFACSASAAAGAISSLTRPAGGWPSAIFAVASIPLRAAAWPCLPAVG